MATNQLFEGLLDVPGVYLFYDAGGTLLYVGKSVAVRSRVRSHFTERSERIMCRRVRRIEVRPTAGELGALLLESRLIKELRPMFNRAQRRRRRIVIARRLDNAEGYATVSLQAVDQLTFDPSEPILGIFKHTTQAKEFLDVIAHSHRLCPKLLRLEQSRGYCFAFHLQQCDGACMGEEPAARYNERLEQAFEERRIKAWPHAGPLAVEEHLADGTLHETLVVDNWCLLGGWIAGNGSATNHVQGSHRFDFDAYKILYTFISRPPPTITVRSARAEEVAALAVKQAGQTPRRKRVGERGRRGEA